MPIAANHFYGTGNWACNCHACSARECTHSHNFLAIIISPGLPKNLKFMKRYWSRYAPRPGRWVQVLFLSMHGHATSPVKLSLAQVIQNHSDIHFNVPCMHCEPFLLIPLHCITLVCLRTMLGDDYYWYAEFLSRIIILLCRNCWLLRWLNHTRSSPLSLYECSTHW